MTKRTLLVIAMAVGLARPEPIVAAEIARQTTANPENTGSRWSMLLTVRTGESVIVTEKSGSVTKGTVSTISDTTIAIDSSGQPRVFQRAEITRVDVQRRRNSRSVKRGVAFGALAGGAVAALTVKTNRGVWITGMAAGWGAVGALIGLIDSRHDEILVPVFVSGEPP